MSDDFDKDDLFWLNDDDDDTPEEDGVTPPAFDDSTEHDAGQLGFTGELSWLGDDDSDQPTTGQGQRLGLTGELPWLQDEDSSGPATESSGRLGLTGELPWMQGDEDAFSTGAEEDVPAWLDAADSAPESPTPSFLDNDPEPAFSAPVDAPDWLTDLDDDAVALEPEPIEEDAADDLGVPDWLQAVDTPDEALTTDDAAIDDDDALIASGPDWLNAPQAPHTPPPAAEVPPWLSGLDADEPEDEFVTADGTLSQDWLSQGDQLADSVESDLTYDEWMAQQEAAERGPDLEAEVPDLADFDQSGDTSGGTGELPDWFLGMEELDTSDAPDWFTDQGPTTGELPSTDSLMDALFGTGELPSDEVPAAQDPPLEDAAFFGQSADEDDIFGEFGEFKDLAAPFDPEPADDSFTFDFLDDDALSEHTPPDFGPADVLDEGLLAELDAITDDAPVQDVAESLPIEDDFDLEALFGLEDDTANADAFDSFEPFEAFDDGPSLDAFGLDMPDEPDAPAPVAPEIEPLDAAFLASLQDDPAPVTPDEHHDDVSSDDLAALFDFPADDDSSLDDAFFTLGDDSVDSDTFPPMEFDLPEAMSIDDTEEPIDWFAPRGEAAAEDTPDWLDGLDELGDSPAAAFDLPLEPALSDAVDSVDDIDALLAGMNDAPFALPQDAAFSTGDDLDFDDLLGDDSAFDAFEIPRSAEEIQLEQDELAAGLLSELGATVGATSASAVVRQQKDRPVEELPDRLKKLRERADKLPAGDISASEALKDILPGVQQVLAPSRIVEFGTSSVANTVQLSESQRQQTDLLKSLVATDDTPKAAAPSAIDLTYTSSMLDDDDALFAGLLDEDESAEAPLAAPVPIASAYQKTRWQRLKKDRLLIAVALFALILMPFFVEGLRIGNLPPAQFPAGSPQESVFNHLSAINAGDRVLVAAEYGPTAAGELDAGMQLILRHILSRGGVPVVVSTNPVSLLRVSTMLGDISPDLQENRDYYIIRYITANMVGLRDLSGNMAEVMRTDLYGQATGLRLNHLDDFSQVVIVAERADDLRDWVEQIAPLTQTPILASIGLSAQPLSQPYVGAGIDGLLVGYQDAFTYAEMLKLPAETLELPPLPTREIIVPTLAPEAEATEEATVMLEGVISAPQAVNLRGGPGTNFPIVGSLAPGTPVNILGYDESGNWVNIALADGTNAYVASNLVAGLPDAIPEQAEEATAAPTLTDLPTDAPAATVTAIPTEAATEAPTDVPTEIPATVTPAPTQTPRATVTPAPTETPISTLITAVVISRERVNARSGPDTTYSVVTSLNPGDTVSVKGRNGDGSWIEIVLEDGREAWVASFLIEISVEQLPDADEQSARPVRVIRLKTLAQDAEPEATAEAESTAEATEEAPEATPAPRVTIPAVSADSPAIPYAEERWYAMNAGLVGIIIIILIGSVVNIARSILRRRA